MSYSWGDDSGSAARSGKKGYDYASARKAYASGMEMLGSKSCVASSKKATPAPIGKNIETESTHPIGIAVDVTGSMSEWPGIIFEKLPLLGKEVERYAPDYAISFTAYGDAYCDSYPLQVRDFDTGAKLDEHIAGLYPEGAGGDTSEDPVLVAYYYLNHCKIDKATKPIFIFITDVDSHPKLKRAAIKAHIGDSDQEDLDTITVLKKLADKFSVYVVLKGAEYFDYWKEIYGSQKVKVMEQPRDVVEILIGIIAGELGEVKDFEMRSSKRHEDRPDRVDRVMKSLSLKDVEVDGKATISDKHPDSKIVSKIMKSKKLV